MDEMKNDRALRCAVGYLKTYGDEQIKAAKLFYQVEDLRCAAEEEGCRLMGLYLDSDVSEPDQPARDRMVENVVRGEWEIEVVLAYELDHLTTNAKELAELKDLLREHGVELVSAVTVITDAAIKSLAEYFERIRAAHQAEK